MVTSDSDTPKVVRAVRVQILRPLNLSWDELGAMLRTQRTVMPQLLRAGMDARIACGVVGTQEVKNKVSPDTKGKSADTIVYQAMNKELARLKECKWADANRPALEVPATTIVALARVVKTFYSKRASFNGAQPIPVDKTRMKLTEEDGRVVLEMKIVKEGVVKVMLHRIKRGKHAGLLRQMIAGDIECLSSKIVRDKDDSKKWYVLISYVPKIEQQAELSPEHALIVHRGVRNALTLAATTGFYKAESGAKLFHQLRTLESRMSETKRVSEETLGSGSKGHGKQRRFEHYSSLSGKRANVVTTWCQQMAAMICRVAVSEGCGTIIIEEYGGIEPNKDKNLRRALIRFPLYELKQCIKNAAETRALQFEEVPAEYVSTTCIACGNNDHRQHNRTTGVFHCSMCSFDRPADFVAALGMMQRSGFGMGVWINRLEAAEKIRVSYMEEEQEERDEENGIKTDLSAVGGRDHRTASAKRPGRRKAATSSGRAGEQPHGRSAGGGMLEHGHVPSGHG